MDLTPEQYAAQYNAAHSEADAQAVKDPAPVLAPVAPEFDTSEAPEGVDVESLPPFRDARRQLPAERIRTQTRLAAMASGLPEEFMDADGGVEVNLSTIKPEDLEAVADLMESIQELVLDFAQDRDAMAEWLMDQEDPIQAVMHAFTVYQDAAGN